MKTTRRRRQELDSARRRVAELLGSQVAAEITSAPAVDYQAVAADIDTENQRLIAENRRLSEEIDAVRQRNRDLTRQLNTPPARS